MFAVGQVRAAVAVAVAGLAAASLLVVWLLGGLPSAGTLSPSSGTIGGPFALTGADGQPVSDRDFRGRWLLIYFGYTHCPDICPTTLAEISQTLDLLGADAAQIQPLFVTIDPDRDTPQIVGDYVKEFDPRIIGLAGKPGEIAAVAKAYRVFYAKREAAGANGGDYLMEHTAFIYVMAPDGRYVTLLTPLQGQTPELMASRLRELMAPVQTGQLR
jgi:protein SCO1/2